MRSRVPPVMQAENLTVEIQLPPDRGGALLVIQVHELTLAQIRSRLREEELNEGDAPSTDVERRENAVWDRVLTVDDVVSIGDLLRMTNATREQLYALKPSELLPLVAKVKAANPVFFRVVLPAAAARLGGNPNPTAVYAPEPHSNALSAA